MAKYDSSQTISVTADNKAALLSFMGDMCAVLSIANKAVAMSSPTPTLLLFSLSSLKTLEPLLDYDQRALLYDIWNDTLKQFDRILKTSSSTSSGVALYMQSSQSAKKENVFS